MLNMFGICYCVCTALHIIRKAKGHHGEDDFLRLQIPAASLRCIIGLVILNFFPIYDRIFCSDPRALTRKPSSITLLQRIRTGIFLYIFILIIAALVETKRLKTAKEYNLVEKPSSTIPMSIWWLVPQYLLLGIADVFTVVGLQDFFYDQVPKELRSIGLARSLPQCNWCWELLEQLSSHGH